MKKALTIVPIFIALSGCAIGGWYKPGATQAEFNQDRYQCQMEVAQTYPVQVVQHSSGGYTTPVQTDCTRYGNNVSCSSTGGNYVAMPTTSYDANAISRSVAFNNCMEARGYRWQLSSQNNSEIQHTNLQCYVKCKQDGGTAEFCRGSYCKE